jgi:hypothetical protein
MHQARRPIAAIFTWSMALAVPQAALAADQPPGPCEQVVAACKSAGFVAGQAKEGSGLWVDCVGPLVRGTPAPANADKALPAVPADVLAACKAKRAGFGEGKKEAAKPATQPAPAQH